MEWSELIPRIAEIVVWAALIFMSLGFKKGLRILIDAIETIDSKEVKEEVLSRAGSYHKVPLKNKKGKETTLKVKEVYVDTLYNNSEILAFLSNKNLSKDLDKWFARDYIKKRVAKGIKALVISPDDEFRSYLPLK